VAPASFKISRREIDMNVSICFFIGLGYLKRQNH